MEPFNMVKYEPGEYFKVHHDGKVRTMTVLVYLNDVLEGDGGETSFPTLGLQFRRMERPRDLKNKSPKDTLHGLCSGGGTFAACCYALIEWSKAPEKQRRKDQIKNTLKWCASSGSTSRFATCRATL
eukprot:419425-Amphidinium_carterae.1